MDTDEIQVKESIETKPFTNWQAVVIGVKIGLVFIFLFFVYLLISSLDNTNFSSHYLDLIGGAMLIPILLLWPAMGFGIAGALTGKHLKKTRRAAWIGALIGSLPVTVIIVYVFLNFCIGFC
jgi:hypothetical protein